MIRRLRFAVLPLVALVALVQSSAAPARREAQIQDVEGRPQVPWDETDKVLNQTAFVYGKVIDVRTVGRITFVNFDANRPARFAGVIFADNMKNFPTPPEQLYKGKIIRIKGRVAPFRDSTEIVIANPSQIEVLDAMPTSYIPEKPKQREPKPGQLKIAAYNILNLFDEHDDPYTEDEATPPKPREEMAAVARSISELDADVLALEEVENRAYLKRFVEVFLPDMGYENVVLIDAQDGRGIDVALLSRVPVGVVRTHQYMRFPRTDGTPERFQRDALCVELLPNEGKPIYAWVVHLKSKRGADKDGVDPTEAIRLAEAAKLRELLDADLARDPNARFVVMGDFNDYLDSKSLKTIIGQGSGALWPANSDAQDPGYLTYNEGEYRSVIDFILCSPAMAKSYRKGSFNVPQGSVEQTGSDHNPISAVFSVN